MRPLMPSRASVAAASCITVLLSRWSLRSHELFTWDAANFAFAMDRIDIASHQPHPPGYVGFVLAARALRAFTPDANAALVLCSVLASGLALLVAVRFAADLEPDSARRDRFVRATAALLVFSPLFWLYGAVGEIYASELLVTLAVAYLAWRSRHGDGRSLPWSVAMLGLAALVKLPAAVLMAPLVALAWRAADPPDRRRAAALLAGMAAAGAGALLWLAPDLPARIWSQFATATAASRPTLDWGEALERFNHNARDTLLALAASLGPINLTGLIAWLALDRRLPAHLGAGTALAWALPWLVLCLAVHIAKPGYLLPLLPVLVLVLAGYYARQPPRRWALIVGLQAVVSVLQFVVFAPFPTSITGGDAPYRSKTLLQRLASDAQPLSYATRATIRQSDADVRRVRQTMSEICQNGEGVIVAGSGPVDARRVMWYFPRAAVVHTDNGSPVFTRLQGRLVAAEETPRTLDTPCPVLWLASDRTRRPASLPAEARREPGVGFVIDAKRMRIARAGLTFEATD
ncbi:MAG TPA: DUF2723 domain-containing protein [Vicinamibacterales bacterium]|nr:DUF2723 domain-containing protein [Vicinamibacterales bacterium]